ncbi:MAG: helix-hairpin-helix domain-containing protein, partial [Geminicoccaceae bacterium]
QLSLAIGRRGQNVRLASQLTGWEIDITTETEDSEKRQKEFKQLTEHFVEGLNVEEVIAQLLVTEGFTTIEEVAYVDLEELASIQGFDEDIAAALRERAESYLSERAEALSNEAAELGIQDDLLAFEHFGLETKVELGRKGVKALDDLADLAGDELVELLPGAGLTEESAGELIMAARAHWFDDEPAAPDAEAASDTDDDEAPEAAAPADEDSLEGERPRPLDAPLDQADDLKKISGVGPKLEEKLNGLGIYHYSQIAAFTPENITWVDGYLSFKGRITRDDWIGQAGMLMASAGDGEAG